MPSWEHFPHEADIGVRGRGETLDIAFEQAARGLTAVVTDPDRVRNDERVAIPVRRRVWMSSSSIGSMRSSTR